MTGEAWICGTVRRTFACMGSLILLAGCTGSDVESGSSTDALVSPDGTTIVDGTGGEVDSPETTFTDPGGGEETLPPPIDQTQWPPCETGGEAGCPCESVDDCHSGWCVTTGEGKQCTVTCDSVCPPGWQCMDVMSGGSDLTYICAPLYTNLCRPCETGEDCSQMGGIGGYCLPDEGGLGSFCGGGCSDASPCPSGYQCAEVTIGATSTVSQCVPEGDAKCACNELASKDGAATSCAIISEHGSCGGTRHCGPDGLSPCDAQIPEAEACNSLDDNCDGTVDDLEDASCKVTNEHGTCQGTQSCLEGSWTPCDAPVPAAEICDGLDDDCDGILDEGFPQSDGDGIADCIDDDDDDDGVADLADNCPQTPNPEQEDLDGDLVGDACDDDIDGDGEPNESDCDPTDSGFACVTYYYDADEDGFGQCEISQCLCEPSGKYTVAACGEPDCDDGNPDVAPGLDEVCDGLDNDCNGDVDEGEPDLNGNGVADACDADDDDDGIPDLQDNCPAVPNADQADCDADGAGDDCDDDDDNDGTLDLPDCAPCDPAVHPGAFDGCDQIDTDCDGVVDDDCTISAPGHAFGNGYVHDAGNGTYKMTHRLGTQGAPGPSENASYHMRPGLGAGGNP